MLWGLSDTALAQPVVDLPHHRAASQAVPVIEHWLRKVTHEPQDDDPDRQSCLREETEGLVGSGLATHGDLGSLLIFSEQWVGRQVGPHRNQGKAGTE